MMNDLIKCLKLSFLDFKHTTWTSSIDVTSFGKQQQESDKRGVNVSSRPFALCGIWNFSCVSPKKHCKMSEKNQSWSGLANMKNIDTSTRLLILRLFLAASLIAAAVACTVASLLTLQNGENSRFKAEYRAVTDGSVKIIANSFSKLNNGIQELASIYSYNFPRVEEWPNVGWYGFNPTVKLVGRSSVVDGMAFLPLIRPEQLASYEAYIREYYATDPYFDPDLYVSPYMPEGTVWAVNYSSVPPLPFHDTTGHTSYGSPNEILTPTTQYTFSSLVGPGLSNFNVHSLQPYGLAIDATIECVVGSNYSYAITSCGALSDVIALPLSQPGEPELPTEDMVALFVQPILPARNQTELVGFAAGALSWRALLSDVFPSYLRPFDIVVETETAVFTFTTEQGVAKFKGQGDLHDTNLDGHARSTELLSNNARVTSSPKYTITIYPTKVFATEFFTDRPKWAAVSLLLVFVYCAALFFAYDYLVQRESGRHEAVLDTKRRFVRFISHEIRTPLNTVRLGMKLLEVELAKLMAAVLTAPKETVLDLVNQNLASWQHLADDIILNSETAVEVLNDLLNYDKIEMGTLRLEFAPVNVCALLKKVIAVMQVQAHQKNIRLELAEGAAEEIAAGRAMIVGDKQRVEQVVRSLIANALKFSPSDGVVTLEGKEHSCLRSCPWYNNLSRFVIVIM
jgi:signal transduction histidine kinase